MHTIVRRLASVLPALALVVALGLGSTTSAQAEPTRYTAVLNGESVEPPTPSTGTADAVVIIDPLAHTMYVYVNFALMGITLQAHIHAPTDVALTGVAAPATATLPDFPFALSYDVYEKTLDMTQESSYSPEFLAANGGTAASAEAALFAAIAEGRAYIDVHTDMYPDGEVRGFLTVNNTPTENVTWGKVKALYR